MESPLREDVLEILYKAHCSGENRVTMPDLACSLGRNPEDLTPVLPEMEREGDLVLGADGAIFLTSRGIDAGGKIMRKHRILECFLSETLGMSPETASEEACILEHNVSDETIDRLGRYLKRPGITGSRGRRRGWICPAMTLMDSFIDTDMVVSCVRCRGPLSHLQDLGIFPGEVVRVIRRIHGNGVVVRVKDCDIALSREIAASIFVEKAE
jgi:DtxR family Mn-dependent transcriptional regulator